MTKSEISEAAARRNGLLAGSVLAVIAAVYAVIAYIVPLALDDYVY